MEQDFTIIKGCVRHTTCSPRSGPKSHFSFCSCFTAVMLNFILTDIHYFQYCSCISFQITVTLRASQKAGLGSAGAAGFSADIANNVDMKKATRRIQAQQRYKQIETGNQEGSANATDKLWTKGATEFA